MILHRLSLPLLLAPVATAQQFVERPGVLTGPVVWSESISPLDVDQDGNLDLFIVNAQGYEVPGDFNAPSSDPLRPTLLIQTGLNAGVPVFEDRTDALIPASIVVHGKVSAVCDVDGDGREDIVIAVAFGDQQRLLRKDPSGPGYLDETFRLPTLVLNSFHVGWGDLDDDGDNDLVFADAGPSSFSAPGGKARLLINNGAGFFSEAPGKLNAINKIGAQNAKIVDVDGDLDLDVVVDGKSTRTQVYINGGDADFTLDGTVIPTAVPGPGGLGAYEVEWGDLDGDLDIDCMYMNFVGTILKDVAMQNQLTETGVTTFVPYANALSGDNAQDENDFALCDVDDDGDLDVLIAALTFGSPATPDKLFINSGSFGPGFLVQAAGAITPFLDATLDVDVADMNNDGRYDLVTANGEIPNTPFDNRYYENVGPIDTTAPTIGRVTEFPATVPVEELAAGMPVRSWIQDSVVDDDVTFVEARLNWRVSKRGFTTIGDAEMPHVGGRVHRALLIPEATTVGLVGATVSSNVAAQDPQANSSLSPRKFFIVCGAESYGAGAGLDLAPPAAASPGGSLVFDITGGDANQPGVLALADRPGSAPFAGGTLLIDPVDALRVPFVLDASGAAQVSVPVAAAAEAGDVLFGQAIAQSTSLGSGLALSGGNQVVVCE